jgi:hypothetical protein
MSLRRLKLSIYEFVTPREEEDIVKLMWLHFKWCLKHKEVGAYLFPWATALEAQRIKVSCLVSTYFSVKRRITRHFWPSALKTSARFQLWPEVTWSARADVIIRIYNGVMWHMFFTMWSAIGSWSFTRQIKLCHNLIFLYISFRFFIRNNSIK